MNALGGKKARSRCARGIQLPLALLSSSHLIDPRPDAASQIKQSAYSSGAFASSLRRGIEGIIKAVERRFLPARRCVVAALPPSLPPAKLVFALCAAFRPAGGRGAAAEAQGMRPGYYGSGLSPLSRNMAAEPMRARPRGLWLKPVGKRVEIYGSCLPPDVHLMLTGSSRHIREL